MSTWSEDFAYSLETLHMPHPGDLSPADAAELIAALIAGMEVSGKGLTVAQALAAAGQSGLVATAGAGLAAVVAVGASAYVGALVGAVLYASAKQSWDAITAPIDLEKMVELAKEWEAPVLELPTTKEVSWYPSTTVAFETVPPAPVYPGHVVKCNSNDTDSVERIQQVLENLGYDVSIDGDFAERTETAVKAFQRDQGIDIDGEVGTDTWEALFGS